MSMFRRPTDSSSESSSAGTESEETEEELENSHSHSNSGTEDVIGVELTGTETLSSGDVSIGDSQDGGNIADVERHRNMMLATLLEDFYKTRAVDLFNQTNSGSRYDRTSPEVQTLAESLFAQASSRLTASGMLPAYTTSGTSQATRQQYLGGLENLAVRNIQDSNISALQEQRKVSSANLSTALVRSDSWRPTFNAASLVEQPMREIAMRANSFAMMPNPANEMRLTTMIPPRSHYQSSFQEMCLLGRGGFGRVYQTYNLFDKKEYAVKKIPLSTKLSQRYRERGHAELSSILREVQALAQLDHCNVVRYHATWIEEPSPVGPETVFSGYQMPQKGQRLIAHTAAFERNSASNHMHLSRRISTSGDDGIMFEVDSADRGVGEIVGPGWSSRHATEHIEPSSAPNSDIFTDGMGKNTRQERIIDDPSCYVLHVQMSMYPMTLTQYLAPAPADAKSGPNTPIRRHCFHLIPTLQILLGILCGIQYIHTRGLIHRDIKPSNIFISSHEYLGSLKPSEGYHDAGSCKACPNGEPYYINPRIGDFGLVAELARGSSLGGSSSSAPERPSTPNSSPSSNKIVGTEYYRPPLYDAALAADDVDANNKTKAITQHHQQSTYTVNEKLDVFALGVILVEMLHRCRTYMERLDLLKNIQNNVIPPLATQINDEESHAESGIAVEECIKGMIDPNPNTRWTCAIVKERIEGILENCRSYQCNSSSNVMKRSVSISSPSSPHISTSTVEDKSSRDEDVFAAQFAMSKLDLN